MRLACDFFLILCMLDDSLLVMNISQLYGRDDPLDFHVFYQMNSSLHELNVIRCSFDSKNDDSS